MFKRIAEQVLTYLAVPHDVPSRSDVETAKKVRPAPPADRRGPVDSDVSKARFEAAVENNEKGPGEEFPTVAFAGQDGVAVPNLAGRSVRAVMEECARLGLVPSLIGSGVALEQFPGAGAPVLPGSRVTVRFGRPGALLHASTRGREN